MSSDTATAILRLVAVVTILLGLVTLTIAFLQIVATTGLIAGTRAIHMTGPLAAMGIFALLGTGSISLWGIVLYNLSPSLGKKIGNRRD